MKRSLMRLCLIVVILCMVVCSISGCSKYTTAIEQQVQDFVVKCNELDMDGILRCMDPAISEPVALTISGIEVISKLNGISSFDGDIIMMWIERIFASLRY